MANQSPGAASAPNVKAPWPLRFKVVAVLIALGAFFSGVGIAAYWARDYDQIGDATNLSIETQKVYDAARKFADAGKRTAVSNQTTESALKKLDALEVELSAAPQAADGAAAVIGRAHQQTKSIKSDVAKIHSALTDSSIALGSATDLVLKSLADLTRSAAALHPSIGGALLGVVRWFGTLFKVTAFWFFLAFLIVWLTTDGLVLGSILRTFVDRVQAFEMFGGKLALATAEKSLVTANASQEVAIAEARTVYESYVAELKLSEKFEKLISDKLPGILNLPSLPPTSGIRATIHFPYFLDDEYLYQLLEYYPGGKLLWERRKRGRLFSQRFGIIGMAWRTGDAQYDANVSNDEKALMESWGMTAREAKTRGTGRKSFVSIPLKDSGGPLAIFYMDAVPTGAFDSVSQDAMVRGQELGMRITQACKDAGLMEALVSLSEKLDPRSHKF